MSLFIRYDGQVFKYTANFLADQPEMLHFLTVDIRVINPSSKEFLWSLYK